MSFQVALVAALATFASVERITARPFERGGRPNPSRSYTLSSS